MKSNSLPKVAFYMLTLSLLTYSPFNLADNHSEQGKIPAESKQAVGGKAWSEASDDNVFTIFKADLTIANEEILSNKKVNKETPQDAHGFFIGAYNNQTHMLNFMIGYSGLSEPGLLMSHFHMRCLGDGKEPPICKPGNPSGPIIQTICGMPTRPGMVPDWPTTKTDKDKHGLETRCSKGNSGYIVGKWTVEEPYRKSLLDKKVFVNLHTKSNPKGEISGILEK
ncbi:CHRD domain-containing protein [Microbulbifer spongiae]|uniref:CHRD domain-containing protein n=1 Tax=Microbulbifer spongiae TaxID=2944933 RepID=A0ABY9EBP6_9GAMM|nr:CHRD domain-containing protein [Microbulbifer sp. MI-G]WKD48201.1 CHRD domain-containing protein [Microbulbifer sp. MI-G]